MHKRVEHVHVNACVIVCGHPLIQQNKRHKRVKQSRTSLWTYNIMFQPSDCLVPSPLPGQGRGPGTHLFTYPQNYPIVDTSCTVLIVSFPDTHMCPHKRGSGATFLGFAESSRCKMHAPIRLMDFKISRDCKVR